METEIIKKKEKENKYQNLAIPVPGFSAKSHIISCRIDTESSLQRENNKEQKRPNERRDMGFFKKYS